MVQTINLRELERWTGSSAWIEHRTFNYRREMRWSRVQKKLFKRVSSKIENPVRSIF